MNYPINGWQWESSRGSYTVIIMDHRDRLCPKAVLFQSGGIYTHIFVHFLRTGLSQVEV